MFWERELGCLDVNDVREVEFLEVGESGCDDCVWNFFLLFGLAFA